MRLFSFTSAFAATMLFAGVTLACNSQTSVCDFPSDSETRFRATEHWNITSDRTSFGTLHQRAANEALERQLERETGVRFACAARVYSSSRGNYNAALCAPEVCLSLPPQTPMNFRLTEIPAGEAIYGLVGPVMRQCVNAHFDRFGWRAWKY